MLEVHAKSNELKRWCSIHRLRGCPNAAKQQLVKRYGPQVVHCLASGRGAKKGSVFATASYKHIVFLYLIGPYYLILVYKVHPFRATPTQAQASVPEVAPGELQVDLDEISESENRFLLREWIFLDETTKGTQIDALSTLIGTWHFHQTVDMFEDY